MLQIIFSLIVFIASYAFADIEHIHSIKKISHHTEGKKNVLAVFDIDDTLTILSDPVFHRPNFKTHHADAFKEIMSSLTPKQQLLAFTMPLLTTDSDLIELETSKFIQDLQSQGVKTIALTAAMGGTIEGFSIEDRRIAELKRVGIDFSSSFPEITEMEFVDFKPPLLGRRPLYKGGILLTNENDKGEVLVAFLKSIPWKPSLILFIDDRIEHIHAVKRAINIFHPEVEFKGFHYQTDGVPYCKTDIENFSKKWITLAEKAKELLIEE